jgi:hypothetical protein
MFKGKGLKPVAFKLWVNRVRRAPPHRVNTVGCVGRVRVLIEHDEVRHRAYDSLGVVVQVDPFESKI